MDNFTKLVLLSTTINHNEPLPWRVRWPRWLKGFIQNLDADNYYLGSIMYSYIWNGRVYFQLEVPSGKCTFCQVFNFRGEFLKWPDNLFHKYLKERTDERLIWQHNNKVAF